MIICFQLWRRINYCSNIFCTSYISNTFLITLTENAKVRSISCLNNFNLVRCSYRVNFLRSFNSFWKLPCFTSSTIPKSQHFVAWIFYLPCILARIFFCKHWQHFRAIELNSHDEQFVCRPMFLQLLLLLHQMVLLNGEIQKNDIHCHEEKSGDTRSNPKESHKI